jgi:hypothetical protein
MNAELSSYSPEDKNSEKWRNTESFEQVLSVFDSFEKFKSLYKHAVDIGLTDYEAYVSFFIDRIADRFKDYTGMEGGEFSVNDARKKGEKNSLTLSQDEKFLLSNELGRSIDDLLEIIEKNDPEEKVFKKPDLKDLESISRRINIIRKINDPNEIFMDKAEAKNEPEWLIERFKEKSEEIFDKVGSFGGRFHPDEATGELNSWLQEEMPEYFFDIDKDEDFASSRRERFFIDDINIVKRMKEYCLYINKYFFADGSIRYRFETYMPALNDVKSGETIDDGFGRKVTLIR